MTRILILLTLVLTLLSCETQQEKVENSDVKNNDSLILEKKKNYKQVLRLPANLRTFIFFDEAKVYSAPDTLSEVIWTLHFSDSQYGLDEYIINNGEYWYKLQGSNPNFRQGGYVKASIMSDYYTSHSKYDRGYLGKVLGEAGYNTSFSLKLFDTSSYDVIQEYIVPNYYMYHTFNALYRMQHELNGVDYIFHYKTDEDQCPSRSYEELIVSINDKLIKLWDSSSLEYDDRAEDQIYTLYIPIRTVNKTVLAPWGNFKNILKEDLSLDIIEPDTLINVSITELVVLKNTKLYSGNIKQEELIFYQWTGRSLKFIKKVFKKD